MTDHAKTIQAMYAAFGRGDIAGILAHLAEDVSWDEDRYPGSLTHPGQVLAPLHGKASVPSFFGIIGKWTFNRFDVKSIMVSGDTAASLISVGIAFENGNRFADDEIHLWTFDSQGKVKTLRHFLDTEAFAAILNGKQLAKAA
jgi:ketosteroid isomerase-like protein